MTSSAVTTAPSRPDVKPFEAVLGSDYLQTNSEADLWQHIETVYQAAYGRDGQIYLFIPGGTH